MFKLIVGAVLASVATSAFAVGEVVWNPNNNAIITGSACNTSDTFILSAGNDMSIVFSRMGINLGDQWAPLGERQNCTVRVPVKIAKGFYLGKLTQTLLYGVTKSGGTSGELSARATFFNLPAAQIKIPLPYGRFMDDSLKQETKVNQYAVGSWCTGIPTDGLRGIYGVNFAVVGQRDNPSESIVVQIDGQDTRYDVNGGWFYCPTR